MWLRRHKDGGYDYIGTYTDDLLFVARDPRALMEHFVVRFKSIRNIGPPDHFLGADYKTQTVDQDAKRCEFLMGTGTYVQRALDKVKDLLKCPNLGVEKTPFKKENHLKMDDTPLLDFNGHTLYIQLIGILYWILLLEQLDVTFVINSLSRFSAAPWVGHLKQAKRVFGYLSKYLEMWVPLSPSKLPPVDDALPNGIMQGD